MSGAGAPDAATIVGSDRRLMAAALVDDGRLTPRDVRQAAQPAMAKPGQPAWITYVRDGKTDTVAAPMASPGSRT
ncbi:MAG TPA: hypothetical protein VHT91_13805 [Kofleriaceae bacterium]|jgi:hypothetical protein|nr:hypothetical protein [Kofleriaceae bacterium]